MRKMERIDDLSEREILEIVEIWHNRSEALVHQLNLKKVELRKEEIQRQK
jgi:hypothetical protein